MSDLSFNAFDASWWPFVFILLAGWLPTDLWRFLGVFSAGKIDDQSSFASLARMIATSLVAGVVAQLVLFPSGSLAQVPTFVRIGAITIGFAAYIAGGKRVMIGVLAAEATLLGGFYLS